MSGGKFKTQLVQQLRGIMVVEQVRPDTPAALVQINAGRILGALSPMPGNGDRQRVREEENGMSE
jgi:hypothetical protein